MSESSSKDNIVTVEVSVDQEKLRAMMELFSTTNPRSAIRAMSYLGLGVCTRGCSLDVGEAKKDVFEKIPEDIPVIVKPGHHKITPDEYADWVKNSVSLHISDEESEAFYQRLVVQEFKNKANEMITLQNVGRSFLTWRRIKDRDDRRYAEIREAEEKKAAEEENAKFKWNKMLLADDAED